MAQSSGYISRRVHIMNRAADSQGSMGRNSAGRSYYYEMTVWASFRFDKGAKSLRQGAVDAYDTVIFGMRYTKRISRESVLVFDDRTWQIKSFNRDYPSNEIQITAVETPGMDLTNLVPSPSSSELGKGPAENGDL